MIIRKGSRVKISFTASLDDGKIFDKTDKGPIEFVVGESQIIPAIEKAIIGMSEDEEKTVKVPAKQGFGDLYEHLIVDVPKDAFSLDTPPERGKIVAMTTPEGNQAPARIIDITESSIKLDLNHPLAGKDLTYNIKVEHVSS